MRVDEIGPRYGARKKPKRVGRGTGGKGGKTAGRESLDDLATC